VLFLADGVVVQDSSGLGEGDVLTTMEGLRRK
jgi:hypothetical protein